MNKNIRNATAYFGRLKNSVPFSERLNSFIIGWFEEHKDTFVFVEEDDFNGDDIEGTFEAHKKRFEDTGKIHIWTGASDGTIFGDPTVNHKFRAWHDYIHIKYDKGYDFIGETMVAQIQKSQLPYDWLIERELIECEIVGQALYFMEHGDFLQDQRAYTINFLNNAVIALTKEELHPKN